MTKEEIALQLALKKLDCLSIKSLSSDNTETFNTGLGKQIASLYNAIYSNLNCFDNKTTSENFVCQTID